MYVMMSLFFCVDPCRNTVSFRCVQDGYMGIIGFHGMYFNACDCAGMLMNACIAISIWHVETEYRMIQASPIHLHYQHMKEVFYRNYRHRISLWRSLYLCLNPCMHAISHFWKLVFDVIADIVLI